MGLPISGVAKRLARPPGNSGGVRLRLKQAKERKIDAMFANWTEYVQDTLTTEDAAFLRVAAVFRGE